MNRDRVTALCLIAGLAWALRKVAAAGITGWPFNHVVYVHAGRAAVLVFLAGLTVAVLAGIGWRPRV